MKKLPLAAIWVIGALLGPGLQPGLAAEDNGLALAIIYDTSGSMRDPVRDQNGRSSPKFVIANRALIAIAKQVQAFSTNTAGAAPRKIDAGLFIFNGDNAKEAIKFGPFDAAALQNWAKEFSSPKGNTPLGNAVNTAALAVLHSPLPRKHILVITDGMNTAGPKPADALARLKPQLESKGVSLSVHFVAFDVDAKVFEPLKKQGVTVVAAADENQLNSQIQFILQRKILLEEEEPKK